MVLSLFCMPGEAQEVTYTGVFTPIDEHIYPGSKTLVAQVKQNGNPVANADLGVFAGDECRAAGIADADGMVGLLIPGDGKTTLTFKVAIGSVIYSATPTLDFAEIVESAQEPFIITVGDVVPTGIEDVQRDDVRCTKVIRNGQVFILRDGKTLDILGNEIH